MSVFVHAEAIAASKATTKCDKCRHHELIIADLQACIEDLRQSRDRWRDLALDTRKIALNAERPTADAARTLAKGIGL
jgi:hypothetical protein